MFVWYEVSAVNHEQRFVQVHEIKTKIATELRVYVTVT